MIKWIKNDDTVSHTYVGQEITAGSYYQIQPNEEVAWANDSTLLSDIGALTVIVSKSDQSSDHITDVNEAINYLKDNLPTKVEPQPLTGESFTKVSHNWCDKTTWYELSVNVVDEVMTDSGDGLTFNSTKTDWINATNGKIYDENTISYPITIKIDDVVTTTGFTINYGNGTVTFDSDQTGNTIKATYNYANGSCWTLKPSAGKKLKFNHVEVQATTDVSVAEMNFEIWVYNPLFNPGNPTDPDDPTWYPGKPGGLNPLRFRYQVITYKNEYDILASNNKGHVIPKFGALSHDILVLPWDYATDKEFKDSEGVQLRLVTKNDTTFSGTWATASFYCRSESE